MAKKAPVVNESKWDGRLLTYIGSWILRLLVLAIFVAAGFVVATLNILDNGKPLADDLQVPMNWVYIALGGILCGIGFCWFCIIGLKYDIKHRVVCGQRMKLKANTWNLFWNCVKWIVLTVITCGIYGLWLPIKIRKWAGKHTVCAPEEAEDEDDDNLVEYPITYYTVDDDGNCEEMVIDD